jgi:hypothetical protein
MFMAETLATEAAGSGRDSVDMYFTVDGGRHNLEEIVRGNGKQRLRTALVNDAADYTEREDCQTHMWAIFCKISQHLPAKGKRAITLLMLANGL